MEKITIKYRFLIYEKREKLSKHESFKMKEQNAFEKESTRINV